MKKLNEKVDIPVFGKKFTMTTGQMFGFSIIAISEKLFKAFILAFIIFAMSTSVYINQIMIPFILTVIIYFSLGRFGRHLVYKFLDSYEEEE